MEDYGATFRLNISEKDSSICSNHWHITGKQHFISTAYEPDSFFHVGLAAANTLHVQYFDGEDH
jgi:hypothetical protein